MSLENKITELTEAVTTLTGALATLISQQAATQVVTPTQKVSDEKVFEDQEPEETPAQIKKREAKDKRDAKRQAALDKETTEAQEADDKIEPEQATTEESEVIEVTVLMLRKVASYIISQNKKPLWHKALADTGAKKLSDVEDRAALLAVIEGIAGMTHDECPDA